jgi:hypothetical protein
MINSLPAYCLIRAILAMEDLMKRLLHLLALAFCLTLLAPVAFACTGPTGPFYFSGVTWYDYGQDPSCWTGATNGALTALSTSQSCSGNNAYRHGYGYSSYEYTFTVASGSQNVWYVQTRLNFNDDNNNFYNYVKGKATVTHLGTPTTTSLFLHRGNVGDLSCQNSLTNFFNAVTGDTVTVKIEAENWYMSGTTIETDLPQIQNANM